MRGASVRGVCGGMHWLGGHVRHSHARHAQHSTCTAERAHPPQAAAKDLPILVSHATHQILGPGVTNLLHGSGECSVRVDLLPRHTHHQAGGHESIDDCSAHTMHSTESGASGLKARQVQVSRGGARGHGQWAEGHLQCAIVGPTVPFPMKPPPQRAYTAQHQNRSAVYHCHPTPLYRAVTGRTCDGGDGAHNAHRHIHRWVLDLLCQSGHAVKANEAAGARRGRGGTGEQVGAWGLRGQGPVCGAWLPTCQPLFPTAHCLFTACK